MKNLPSQDEIMSVWGNEPGEPVVSICCITYNHEAYIQDALTGFLSQRTDFPFEILIHDDASTDKTADVIRKYEQEYPKLIKPIYQKKNQYSQGKMINFEFNLPRVKSEFIALCEGDDYWTDEVKLQKQFEVLREHKDLDLCFHLARKQNYETGKESDLGQYRKDSGHVKTGDIIIKSRGQIPTGSTFIRSSALVPLLKFFSIHSELTVGDIYFHMFSAFRGGAYFLNENMSVYRHGHYGSWNHVNNQKWKTLVEHKKKVIDSLYVLDEFTDGRYRKFFLKAIEKRSRSLITDKRIPYEVSRSKFSSYIKSMSVMSLLKASSALVLKKIGWFS